MRRLEQTFKVHGFARRTAVPSVWFGKARGTVQPIRALASVVRDDSPAAARADVPPCAVSISRTKGEGERGAAGRDIGIRRRTGLAGLARCRRASASVEFALTVVPLTLLIFGGLAATMVFQTLSTMQNNAQYSARMLSTGQIKRLATGFITTSTAIATTTCSGSLTSTQAEYYACLGLPSYATFTVTTTQNCTVPSVSVTISVSAGSVARGDVSGSFVGKTMTARSELMKEGLCPS